MSDITLEQFEAEATAFLDTNASLKAEEKKFVWGEGSDKVAMFDEKARTNELEELAKAQAWRAEEVRRRLRLDHRPDGLRRPRAVPAPTTERGTALEGQYECRTRASSASGSAWSRPTILAHAQRHREGPLPDEAVPRRHRRLPAVQRARRRQRPRSPADQGRARRRRVDHHRPEGVDLGRAVQRHRRDHLPHRPRPAQAQGPHRLHRRHARARRRDPPAAPDDGRRVVQRGVLQRRARPRRPPPRRRQPRAGRSRSPRS